MRTAAYIIGGIVGGIIASFFILLGVALFCVAVRDLTRPLATVGLFSTADYPVCATVKPPPLRPQKRENGAAPVSELA